MPVVIEEGNWAAWLDPDTEPARVEEMLVPAPSDLFEAYPVSTLVNNVANDGPELITRLPDPP
jgi:putative SOS response-associated peptidase YedK